MTAIRKSYRIAPERSFGSGEPKNGIWYEVPQGMYLSHSDSTQAASLYGTGAKIRQNTVYGPFQGSWNASFVMDFEHLEILSMIFDVEDETYSAEKPYGANRAVSGMTGVYDHVFRKHNSRRQPSYVIQERVLNIIAGGEYDETVTLKGVLARNIQLARSTSGSQMAAEISGVFADKCTELHSEQQESFFTPVSDPLSQYSCMYMGLNADPADTDAVEQVDSHSIQIETSVSLVYSTCSPIATGYFEDKTTFSWNASAYMNNPTKKFKLLSNSGGTLDPKVGDSLKITDPDNGRSYSKQPMGKNLAPLEFVNFITYAESYRDEYSAVYASRVDAYDNSQNLIRVQAVNSTVKVSSTPKGDGSKLQDSLSSVECDEIIITVRNRNEKIWTNTWSDGGSSETAETEFTQDNLTFPMPVSGYSGQILGFVALGQSETATDTIVLDENSTYTDLTDYTVITDPQMLSDDEQYRLDNLVPKQLTAAGSTAGPSGLTVTNGAGGITISGTPIIKRTDYYFIVKEDTETETAVYTTGYLCVSVR